MSEDLRHCIDLWNAQADEYNQWDALDADERCEWCIRVCLERDTKPRQEGDQ